MKPFATQVCRARSPSAVWKASPLTVGSMWSYDGRSSSVSSMGRSVTQPQAGTPRGMERDQRPHEEDVDPDDGQALSRPSGQFVGQRAVDDEDAAQQLGGERRAEAEQQQRS